MKKFNNTLADSQATEVQPVCPDNFNMDEYQEYANSLNTKCQKFWESSSGVLVYRRMRVASCFSFGCRDMKFSLENQLGALQMSMAYKSDIPNFLEPWYGIGTIASAFGGHYTWHKGNAPAMKPLFNLLDEILSQKPAEVSETEIGKHTLSMIEYFMEKTKGKIPVSFTDSQSPLNIMTHLLPLDNFFTEFLTNPDKIKAAFRLLTDLTINFNKKQEVLIGNSAVFPGHGFASSQVFSGFGVSDDNAIMISPEQYLELAVPSIEKIGKPFGGVAFHSCGDWTNWIESVLKIKNLTMVDAAVSAETDPGATDNLEAFHSFADTGVTVNARIVGNLTTIEKQVRRLWRKGMKLIIVTYCSSVKEQEKAYDLIHEVCT